MELSNKAIQLKNLPRTVGNPVTGETVTFIRVTEETEGEYLYFSTYLDPNDGIKMHYHLDFTETIEMREGELTIKIGRKGHVLTPGERITVPTGMNHTLWNHSQEFIKFDVTIEPAKNFERFVRCGYGLKVDNRTFFDKSPIPKNPLIWGILFQWGGSYLPYIPLFLQNIFFGFLARLGKRLGVDKSLQKYYMDSKDKKNILQVNHL